MRNAVVVDASIAIKWVLKEADSHIALALLNDWIDREIEIHAPSLLAYEVTNILYRRALKGEMPFYDAGRGLTDIIYKVVLFDYPVEPAFNIRAMELGRLFGLPATYDSHYLALSERMDCELWTADLRLWNSVKENLSRVHFMDNHPIS